MKRGDVIIAAERGALTGKPRPYVVVQRGTTLAESVTVTACPVTTGLIGGSAVRIPVDPDAATGLSDPSEVQVDRITTLRKAGIKQVVGSIPADKLATIDVALKRWLDI